MPNAFKLTRQEASEECGIPKADTLYAYRNPHQFAAHCKSAREYFAPDFRRSMELLYDTNALELALFPTARGSSGKPKSTPIDCAWIFASIFPL